MLTDDQLIQRIRSSLQAEAAQVQPPPDFLARLRRARLATAHRLAVPRLDRVLIALAAGSAVAVAVLVIVLVGHQRSTAPEAAATPPPARALMSELAILRRPQTAADRSLPAWAIRGVTFGNPRDNPLPALTRLAATLPTPPADGATVPRGTKLPPSGPVSIFLIVSPAPSARSRSSPPAAATVTALVISGMNTPTPMETGTDSATARQLHAPITLIPCTCGIFSSGPGYNVSIVPDGVARVRWVFDGYYAFMKKHRKPFAVYPAIHNNIAVAPIQRNQGSVTGVTWYAADGQVIRQQNPGSAR